MFDKALESFGRLLKKMPSEVLQDFKKLPYKGYIDIFHKSSRKLKILQNSDKAFEEFAIF